MENMLGPLVAPIVKDEFTYTDVKGGECLGQTCKRICRALKAEHARPDGKKPKFLCICVPCYNESVDDLMKTISSLMENVDFMKHKTKFNPDEAGQILKEDFEALQIVVVPIFDGMKAMDSSIREWLTVDMPGALDDLDGPNAPNKVEVRVMSAKWWYYCFDKTKHVGSADDEFDNSGLRGSHISGFLGRNSRGGEDVPNRNSGGGAGRGSQGSRGRANTDLGLPNGNHLPPKLPDLDVVENGGPLSEEGHSFLHFQLIPIIKRSNHRKHNSHHWFFQGICVGLNASLVFLTDCGTTYKETCLARLAYDLRCKPDLIGVTARQRVETPNANFHCCELTKIPCLRGKHKGLGDPACWKCWLSYMLSPAPLQGFEFEATLILNSALFNLVEAMPVLPGPCQLLDWPKLRKNRVVEEYFDLLFNEDTDDVTSSPVVHMKHLPRGYRNSGIVGSMKENLVRAESSSVSETDTVNTRSTDTSSGPNSPHDEGEEDLLLRSSVAAIPPPADAASSLTFTEFLRVNMRLAEDRVLSFVTVFSTGFGTKWIPGATFFYEPEVTFQTLLTQRRRWINGTVASFMYFFKSKRARLRVMGGFFDSHKAGKSLRFVNMLWALQLLQFVLVLISPCVFGVALHSGLKNSAKFSSTMDWAVAELYDFGFYTVQPCDIALFVYFVIYILWTINSFYAKGGKVPEEICVLVVFLGFLAIFPVYYALIVSALVKLGTVHWIVICSVLGPIAIAISQSASSAALYCFYLPWFLSMAVFFLVYVPAYSFARLWDTTWGNRETAKDGSINENREIIMKNGVFRFMVCLIIFNIAAATFLCFALTPNAQLIFMLVLFTPAIIQLIGSIFFLLIVVPFRAALQSRSSKTVAT